MGWVMMSERELNRVEVLAQVDDGRLTVDNAANMLNLTRRQIFRLLKRYRQGVRSAISKHWKVISTGMVARLRSTPINTRCSAWPRMMPKVARGSPSLGAR